MNPFSISPDSWLRECTQFLGDGFYHATKAHVEELPAKLAIPFRADEFGHRVMSDARTHDLSFHDLFSAFKDVVKEKTKLSQTVETQENVFSLKAAQVRKQGIEAGKVDLNKISVDELLAQHQKRNPSKPTTKVNAVKVEQALHSNVAPPKSPGANPWERTSTGEKVNAGLWGVGAIMGAFGALSAAQNSVARDEENKAHIIWSQVGVCLLQAAVAAGCAYMGVQALHGRSVG